MKKIEGTIMIECDVCWRIRAGTSFKTCYRCGFTACLVCRYFLSFRCPVCGSDFIKPIPSE
jgi:rRNA maturation protein Nop10